MRHGTNSRRRMAFKGGGPKEGVYSKPLFYLRI
jgi:hypothetical protein